MILLSIIAAAAAPGFALLSYIYLKDRYEAEPISIVARLFMFGLLAVFPVMFVQVGLTEWLGDNAFVFSFVTTAAIEETFKWLIVILIIFRHTEFNEPYDGIVYATAVSLGFATMENLLYVYTEQINLSLLIIRALLPVSGHALFGIIMGYYIGQAKFIPYERVKYLIYALVFPILWHGLFDFIIIKTTSYWTWFIIPLMTFLWFRGLRKMKFANLRSPFHIIEHEEKFKL
jgi:RsiW-degrading membrane proteinase PrsW (M82 family)